jgi:hypothetical protein
MVNISGPSLSVGPPPLTVAAAHRRRTSPPPPSRDSTPALPPLTINHGAQVHVAAGSAAAIRIQQRPLPLPGERATSADSVRKIR